MGRWLVFSNCLENISIFLLWVDCEFWQEKRLLQAGEQGWILLVAGALECWALVFAKILVPLPGTPVSWPVSVKERLPLFVLVQNKGNRWRGCFLAFWGKLDDDCRWLSVPKHFSDFVLDDKIWSLFLETSAQTTCLY